MIRHAIVAHLCFYMLKPDLLSLIIKRKHGLDFRNHQNKVGESSLMGSGVVIKNGRFPVQNPLGTWPG